MQQLTKTMGGLISFNNFLHTSKNRNILLDLVAILLIMNINSSKSTTSFDSTSDVSYFHGEDQVLFLMQTLSRIRDIKPIGENNRLDEVNLTLITDNDKDLHTLINHIREEIFPNTKEWHQLNLLLLKTDHSDKAQDVYQVILDQTMNETQRGSIYRQLGLIKYIQGLYTEAITLYEKSINIDQKTLSQNHPNSSISYTGIANTYSRIGCTR
jgi:tetratricopeptide (TPR) repeat protein